MTDEKNDKKDEEKLEETSKMEDSKDDKKDEEKEVKVDKSVELADKVLKAVGGLDSKIDSLQKEFEKMKTKVKAMEEPSDLPIKPAVSADEDIGAKVTVPDEYQSNSEQTSIKEETAEIETDKPDLKMQTKSVKELTPDFTATTPRAGVENVMKSDASIGNPILKAARAQGFEGLQLIAKDIQAGKYGRGDQ